MNMAEGMMGGKPQGQGQGGYQGGEQGGGGIGFWILATLVASHLIQRTEDVNMYSIHMQEGALPCRRLIISE